MKHLILALALILAAPAAQSDIRIKMDQIAKGSSVTYLIADGTRRTHHFEGGTNDRYEVSFWNGRGKGQDAGLYGIAIYDADGRILRGKQADGAWVTYTPHNCFRVLGECRYTVKRDDGRVWELGRRQEPTDDGFTFENFAVTDGVQTVTARGRVIIDAMGMMQSLTVEEGSLSDLLSMTQERADYR